MWFKPGWLVAAVLVLTVGGCWLFSRSGPPPTVTAQAPAPPPPPPPVPDRIAARGDCARPEAFEGAAAANAASLTALAWAPFGRQEIGWATYQPLVAREIASACAGADPGFAAALARWQTANRLPADGLMSAATFEAMRVPWLRRRPFVIATAKGVCPPGADKTTLVPARMDEGYSGKAVVLSAGALTAYRQMVDAARRESRALAADKRLLTIFSAYRSPAENEARCAGEACGGPARARCSAHRTGTALDLYVGEAPGHRPESSADPNRLHQSRGAAYLWLVANADRFGFVPYAFEPWHWEWAG